MTFIMEVEVDNNEESPETSPKTWDMSEMESYLQKGLCDKVETTERIGIHPYWLRDIITGAMEELREDLGKWSKKFNGYIIGFHRPRQLPELGTQGEYPHPHIYYKFNIVRYIYRPMTEQKLKGVITQFGENAASCVVFQTFMATVYPKNVQEFNSWNVGDEINFVVEKFDQLRKCVMLSGTSIETSNKNTINKRTILSPLCPLCGFRTQIRIDDFKMQILMDDHCPLFIDTSCVCEKLCHTTLDLMHQAACKSRDSESQSDQKLEPIYQSIVYVNHYRTKHKLAKNTDHIDCLIAFECTSEQLDEESINSVQPEIIAEEEPLQKKKRKRHKETEVKLEDEPHPKKRRKHKESEVELSHLVTVKLEKEESTKKKKKSLREAM